MRIWHEIDCTKFTFAKTIENKWVPHHKGGDFRKWYGNRDWVIDWFNDGEEIKSSPNSGLQGKSMYFNPFASWSKISSKGNPLRYFDSYFLFDSGAPAISNDKLLFTMGFLNGKVGQLYLSIISPTINLQVGDVKSLPLIVDIKSEVEKNVFECINVSQTDWDSFETSWDFAGLPIVQYSRQLIDATSIGAAMDYYYGCQPKVSGPLELCYLLWKGGVNKNFKELKANEEELNRIFIDS